MVFAALAGGVIAGALLPAGKQPAKVNLPAGSATTGETTKKHAVIKNADEQDGLAAKIPRLQPADNREKKTASTCRQETWPYYSHTCLDGAAGTEAPVQVIRTRRSDPAVAMDGQGKEKAQTAATSNPAPRAEATPPAKSSSSRRTVVPAEARGIPEADQRASERPQVEPAPGSRPRYRTRQAELPDDWDEDSPRVIVQGNRRIYVYPNVREERWIAPRPWRDW
jgi:hypothetical protein